MCNAFLQQYIQYLQSMGFILVQVRPPSPTTRRSVIFWEPRCWNRADTELCPGLTQQETLGPLLKAVSAVISSSTSRIRALAAMGVEGRGSFSYTKPKAEGSPKVSACLLEVWNWDGSQAVEWGSSPGWLLSRFQAERM